MSTNIPQWALDRAWKLIQQTEPALSFSKEPAKAWMFAFARYIAEHEEPPVDPLEEKLEKEADRFMRVDQPTRYIVLAALRRGIEIGKSGV
jgi:hypothetical protein